MQHVGLSEYISLASMLFTIGVMGIIINRKNVILILMCIEMMLLAADINMVAFSSFMHDLSGQVFAFFILTVAAAEIAIGLAIVTIFYRNRGSINVDDSNMMRG